MRAITRQHLRGFTIIEMLIVVAVIAILATIMVVGYNSVTQRAASQTLEGDLTRASSKLNSLKADAGTYPVDLVGASLEASGGTEYQYTYNSVANNYCLTAKNASEVAYHIANDGVPVEGPCNGHTGNPPTDLSCPSGYVTVPGNSLFNTQKFCVMKYEAKDVGGVATSQVSGTPWGGLTTAQASATAAAACSGCHLMTNSEWLTLAHNILVQDSNWTGGTVGSGTLYRGMNDATPNTPQEADSVDANGYAATGNSSSSGADQRRTLNLSNGQVVWDLLGNVWEWIEGTVTGNQPGGSGFAYREWNTISSMAGLPSSLKPSYGNEAAASWTTAEAIGAIYSNTADTTTRGIYRGGAVNQFQSSNNGLFQIALDRAATSPNALVGFRVAK